MKRRLGQILLLIAAGLCLYMLVSWALWSISWALRMMQPAVMLGVVVIIAIIGVYLLGEK